MVCNMVPVIETVLVVEMVDQLHCQCTVVFKRIFVLRHRGDLLVYKDVLRVVSEHQDGSNKEKGNNESPQSCEVMVIKTSGHSSNPCNTTKNTLKAHVIMFMLVSPEWKQKDTSIIVHVVL